MSTSKKSTSMFFVYEKILQKIINEQLLPGTPLREDRIAEEFHVSSTPVREAFPHRNPPLAANGSPGAGSFAGYFS